MPKKMGVNSKAEEARARKNALEADKKSREVREKEEQYWREAEGSKSRAAKKREEESEKRAEAAARKAEARRLAEQEEKELLEYRNTICYLWNVHIFLFCSRRTLPSYLYKS